MLADSSVYVRAAILRALPWGGAVLASVDASHPLLERMTAAEALGTLREGGAAAAPDRASRDARAGHPVAGAIEAMRAGLDDPQTLYAASCAGALADLGDSASVPRLARAWTKHVADADADARISIRDALRALAGRHFADSLERVAPPRNAQPADYPPGFETPPAVKGAVIHTSAGDITWEFYAALAPQTVRNFVTLAGKGYFDGCSIHRVVPNFVIQDGDPTGTGSGGPGYTIRCEYNRLRYDPGMVGMALSGKDTGGSQWFITHSPQHHLDGRYTIFAHVTAGMDVVKRVVQGDRVLKVEIVR
jgi:cyclophilin family peptidyl-prolyl cis-trans isomerase